MFLAVFTVLTATTVKSQESYKPAAGNFSVEAGISPFSENGPVSSDGTLTGTYFISGNWSFRLELGLDFALARENNGETGTETRSAESQNLEFALAPGINYYFPGTNRLSPYVGGALLFATGSIKHTEEYGTVKKTVSGEDGSFTAFGLGVYTGFNYYIAKNIYLGIEIELAGASTSIPNEKTEYSGMDAPSSPATSKNSQGLFNLSIGANPLIRLGYSF